MVVSWPDPQASMYVFEEQLITVTLAACERIKVPPVSLTRQVYVPASAEVTPDLM